MDYRTRIQEIRGAFLRGELTYDQAKETAQPLIDEMNVKAEAIAKEHGQKFRKFTFNGIMR
jgi:hypothetical protein